MYCVSGDELSPPHGICNWYYGKICKGYLNDSVRVWFNNSKESGGGEENENIVKGLWKEMIESVEEKCRSAAEVCHNFALTLCLQHKREVHRL